MLCLFLVIPMSFQSDVNGSLSVHSLDIDVGSAAREALTRATSGKLRGTGDRGLLSLSLSLAPPSRFVLSCHPRCWAYMLGLRVLCEVFLLPVWEE